MALAARVDDDPRLRRGSPEATAIEKTTPIAWEQLFDPRVAAMREASIPLGKLLNVSPDAISFAGGYPSKDAFLSKKETMQVVREAQDTYPDFFQYGKAQGTEPFRRALLPYLEKQGAIVDSVDNIAVTSSSQAGLVTMGELFLGAKETKVAIPEPVYLGLIGAWSRFQPTYIKVKSDQYGIMPESLDDAFRQGAVIGYVVPNFDNPTGVTMPEWRREQIARVAEKNGKPIIEDDPYYWLRYYGEHKRSIKSYAENHIIYMSSASKVIGPGLRLGFVTAPQEVIEAMVAAKPDLCTGNVVQAIATVFISSGRIWPHIERIKALYKPRHDHMFQAIHNHFPPGWEVQDTEGGMFFWPVGPEGTDTAALFELANKQNIAILDGEAFCTDKMSPLAKRAMRLNYTNQTEEAIERGIQLLGSIIKEMRPASGESVEVFSHTQ